MGNCSPRPQRYKLILAAIYPRRAQGEPSLHQVSKLLNYAKNNQDNLSMICTSIERRIVRNMRRNKSNIVALSYYLLIEIAHNLGNNLPLYFDPVNTVIKLGLDSNDFISQYMAAELLFYIVQAADIDTKDRLLRYIDSLSTLSSLSSSSSTPILNM